MSNMVWGAILALFGAALVARAAFGWKDGQLRDRGDGLTRQARPRWFFFSVLTHLIGGVVLLAWGIRLVTA